MARAGDAHGLARLARDLRELPVQLALLLRDRAARALPASGSSRGARPRGLDARHRPADGARHRLRGRLALRALLPARRGGRAGGASPRSRWSSPSSGSARARGAAPSRRSGRRSSRSAAPTSGSSAASPSSRARSPRRSTSRSPPIAIAMLASLGHALRRAREVRQRVQAAVVFAGALVAFLFPSLAVLAFFPLGWSFSFTWITSLLLFFPVSILYAIARYDLLGAERFIRITVGYTVASARRARRLRGARLHARPARRAGRLAQPGQLASRCCSAIAIAFDPIRRRVQRGVDRVFYRTVLDAGRVLEEAGTELATLPDEAAILRLAPERLRDALQLEWVEFGAPGAERADAAHREPVVFRGETLGVLLAGPKRSGAPWSAAERELARGLAAQLALALRNARSARRAAPGAGDAAPEGASRAARRVRRGRRPRRAQPAGRHPRRRADGARAGGASGAVGETLGGADARGGSPRPARADAPRLLAPVRAARARDAARPAAARRRVRPRRDRRARAARRSASRRSPALPDALDVDPDYLEEALLELGGNALRVLAPGGEVVLSAGREGERAVLRVRDDGPGVREGVRARLFEPFFTTRPDGTGMGLPTVRKVIEQMGGRCELEATGPDGTTLPRRAPARARLGNREVVSPTPRPRRGRRLRSRMRPSPERSRRGVVVGVAEPRVCARLRRARRPRRRRTPSRRRRVGKEHLEAQQPLGGLDLEEAVGVVEVYPGARVVEGDGDAACVAHRDRLGRRITVQVRGDDRDAAAGAERDRLAGTERRRRCRAGRAERRAATICVAAPSSGEEELLEHLVDGAVRRQHRGRDAAGAPGGSGRSRDPARARGRSARRRRSRAIAKSMLGCAARTQRERLAAPRGRAGSRRVGRRRPPRPTSASGLAEPGALPSITSCGRVSGTNGSCVITSGPFGTLPPKCCGSKGPAYAAAPRATSSSAPGGPPALTKSSPAARPPLEGAKRRPAARSSSSSISSVEGVAVE